MTESRRRPTLFASVAHAAGAGIADRLARSRAPAVFHSNLCYLDPQWTRARAPSRSPTGVSSYMGKIRRIASVVGTLDQERGGSGLSQIERLKRRRMSVSHSIPGRSLRYQ